MRVRVFCFVVLALILCSLLASVVHADDLQNTLDNTGMSASQAQEYIDAQRWNFLSGEWKEFFMKNPFIQRFDSAMHKLNPLYIVLFARDYSLSVEMLLVFMMWLFTLFSFPGYLYFIGKESASWIAGFAGTIVIAHLQIFNYLAAAAIKVIFYRSVWYWSLITFVVCIAMITGYLYLNRYISGYLKAARELNEKRGLETSVKRIEAFQKGQKRGLES